MCTLTCQSDPTVFYVMAKVSFVENTLTNNVMPITV